MTLNKTVGCGLLVAIAACVVPLGAEAAQKAGSAASKTQSPQQQACAVKCEADVESWKADDEEMDEPDTPQDVENMRRACMSTCLGRPEAGIGNAPGQKAQSSSCGNIVGTWNWPNGSQMVFYKNGTAGTAGQSPGGTWTCSGGTVSAAFSNGGRDQYKVAPDGNTLSFTTNWLPGTYTATRTSR